MRITNNFGLPMPIVMAVSRTPGEDHFRIIPGKISVSKLIMPIKQAILMDRYDSEMEEDVVDRFWMMLGSAMHVVVEGTGKATNHIIEQPISTVIDGWEIRGRFDLWHRAKMSDYKLTSVWSYIFGNPEDYEEQLNIYSYMSYVELFLPTNRLEVNLLFRDWQRSKAENDRSYPDIPFHKFRPRVWMRNETLHFMEERVSLYKNFLDAPDDDLPDCSDKDRYARADKFAVYLKKSGSPGQRAKRVVDTKKEAGDYITWLNQNKQKEFENDIQEKKQELEQKQRLLDNGNKDGMDSKQITATKRRISYLKKAIEKGEPVPQEYIIELRKGESMKCKKYCPVLQWCKQGTELVG